MKKNYNQLMMWVCAYTFILMAWMGCEKAVFSEKTDVGEPTEPNVVLRFVQQEQFVQEAFRARPADGDASLVTRAATAVTELCSRLNIVVFSQDGTKVKTVSQKEGDAGYGTVALSLAAGTYKLVVIAHNGDGAATITSEDKVTFPSNKVTDTFYYYGDLSVGSDNHSYDIMMTRAVAMFRLVLTDENMPSNVAQFRFYYLGGSSTFSPVDGYGCVNSKQSEFRAVSHDGIYEIYTLPHTEEDVLTKLTITAYDANDNIILEKQFEDVPVVRNQVTQFTGSFFGSGGGGGNNSNDSALRLMADPDWGGVNSYTF